jgi:hypothetical protein
MGQKRGMRRWLLLAPLAVVGCHESELEPKAPEWGEPGRGAVEATYAMAPVPAVIDPAPVRERPRSISLGYIGDAPLTETPPSPPRWPYVEEPFRYQEPYATPYGFGLPRRGRWVYVPASEAPRNLARSGATPWTFGGRSPFH